jgi:hypothetical protein
LYARDANTPYHEDGKLVVVQFTGPNTMRLNFGPWDPQTITLSGSLAINTFYSFTLMVQSTGVNNRVLVTVFVNTEANPRFQGQITGIVARGPRVASLGGVPNDTNEQNYLNGLFDNFVIFDDVVSEVNRKSLHSPHHGWSPATSILNKLALWIHFDDALLALQNSAVAVTKIENGQTYWVHAQVVGGGFFQNHGPSIGGESWRNCQSTGDPHYYDWNGQHVGGGEQLRGHYVFQTCDNEDYEIRTHTRHVVWWGATVFRVATLRYKDYVWRINLDERGDANTRAGTANIATQVAPGRYMKQINDAAWSALGAQTINHQTGARYVGDGSGHMTISVPDVATFTVHQHGQHMALYITMNHARCVNRRGSCERQLYISGDVFFNDLVSPPALPDVPPFPTTPCTGVDAGIVSRIEAACARYYPNTASDAYDDCRFDACASGDPEIIPESDLTPACQLERLTGVANPECDVTTCQGNCFGRGDCVDGQCENCDVGFGGFDCFQQDAFTCHTVAYGPSIEVNVEPRNLLQIRDNNLGASFADYAVWQSLLIYPVTYQGAEYLQFVVNSAQGETAGSFRVCVDGTNNAGPVQVITKPEGKGVAGVVSSQVSGANPNICVDVEFSAYSVGGFYFQINGFDTYTIRIPQSNGLNQVLIGSQNGRGGLDVSKVPQTYLSAGFQWRLQNCDNTVCHQHDEDCMSCHAQAGCGFCQETQRCMSGTESGPRRGTCENWRFNYGVSRVVTTKFNGDDLVDPDYEVFLSSGDNGVPVSIYVPTARTNANIDIQFMFGTRGTFASNAVALKNNLLNSLFAFDIAMNLGIGFYGDVRSVINLDLTRVDAKNHNLFARALEAPAATVGTNTGGVFASLRSVAGQTGYRKFSRRLAVFTVYEIEDEANLPATREKVLGSDVFAVFLIPRGVAQNVVDYYTNLNNRIDGIPSLVLRIDRSGSDFQSAFRQIFLLSASYPHVVITDLSDNQYNHVDQTVLADEADSLSIAGLTNMMMRARFNIPMKHNGVTHHVARINIPGFGHSLIEDVADIVPVVASDRSFSGLENAQCIQITLSAETFNNLAAPVYRITSQVTPGKIYRFDASNPNNIGEEVVVNQWNAESTYCFVPVAHDHSLPASAVYASFTYQATDGCAISNTGNVDIFVTPVYFPPSTEIDRLVMTEDEQEAGSFSTIPFTIFEADRFDNGQQEVVSMTFSSFSVDYMNSLHGAAPVDFYSVDVAGGNPIVPDQTYGPYTVDVNYEIDRVITYNPPANPNFFGTLYAYLTLTDDGNRASIAYPVVAQVTPINDVPTASVNIDPVFDATGQNQWVREDDTTILYITGEDLDNFEIGVDLRVTAIPTAGGSHVITANGRALTTEWQNDICVADVGQRRVICEITYTPPANYYSCFNNDESAIPSFTTCDPPAVTIEYRVNDHNLNGFAWPSTGNGPAANAVSPVQTVSIHVLSINDPPAVPANTIVELVEDQALAEVIITINDIDSAAGDLDLWISNMCPDLIELYQNNNDLITGDRVEILDRVKRQASQDHSFGAKTIANLHGTDRETNWEICRLSSTASDGKLESLSDGFVSLRVRPVNDAPYDLLSYFEKDEDVNEVYNVMDLTATDLDNELADLTYVITQLPWYDLALGEGVVIHVIDPTTGRVDEDVFLTEDDLPYTVQKNDGGEALVWVRNLANWYGELTGENTLIYQVTDIDAFLNPGETGYQVNTVPSTVVINIPPVNDRPITTVQPPAGNEDVVQLVHLLGENDKYGEDDDILTVTIVAIQSIYSNSYNEDPQLYYQFNENWYNSYVLDPTSVSVSALTPINLGEDVTDPFYRILFVPPQNMNRLASQTESPLFISPRLQYQMVEIDSHAEPVQLRSVISDWVGITVNPVNDAPVTWGSEWNVESNPAYDEFYGGNAWTYPEGYGNDATTFDNTVCIDDCFYTEDFGFVGHYLTLSPREIKFGGRDVEGDDLEVVIRSVDCQAELTQPRNPTWELINSTGRFPVATEDLVGMTLGRLVERIPGQGYRLASMLTFAPARNDWNVPSAETHENDQSGEESSFYCQLTYALVDSEGLASDDAELGQAPKTITLQVRQQNDQPTDTVLQDPENSATLIGYEDTNLYIRFDASDVEDDDFTFRVVSCDNSRGKFFFPSPAQGSHIDENGDLNLNVGLNALFDLRNEINCQDNVITNPERLYSSTVGKGWYVLFQPNPNDFGVEFSHITVSYDDGTVNGQAVQFSDRFIDIRPVNDPPVILSGGEPAADIRNQLVVQNGNNVGLALSFVDNDAVLSDGTEFSGLGFQLRVSSASLNNENNEVKDAFVYSVAPSDEEFIQSRLEVQPTNEDLGLVRWVGSISQANSFASRVAVNFEYLGTYTIEIVAVDGGRTGYCTPDVVLDQTVYPENDIRTFIGTNGQFLGAAGYEDSRCNRVSVVELQVKVNSRAAVIGGIATGAGAGLLALLALGAIVFAKLKKPEDLDAWQALDNAQLNNVQVSGIHQAGKTGGTSALYQGAH